MKIEDLKNLLQTEEVLSNLALKADLENLFNENKYSSSDIYWYPLNISVDTYKYLLEKHDLDLKSFFNEIITSAPGEKHDQLLDLALSKKIYWDSLFSLRAIAVSDLEKCFSKGLTLNQAAKLVLAYNYHHTDSKSISLQENLVKYLGEKGANFIDAYWVPSYFAQETYEYMLEHRLKAESIFRAAITLEPGERHDQLLDLALSKTIYWDSLFSLRAIAVSDLEKFVSKGLTLNQAAKLVLAYNYHHTDSKGISLQENLVKYLGEKGANFIDAYSVPSYFAQETYEYMLEHRLKAESIFRAAITLEPGERHDQLLDLALSKKIDFSYLSFNLNNLSEKDLEKFVSKGLSLEILVGSIFRDITKTYNPGNIEYSEAQLTEPQIVILNKAKDQGIEINKIFDQIANSRSTITDTNGQTKPYIIPQKILEVLLKNYALDANLILEYGITNKVTDIVKFALANNADVNYKKPDNDISLFVQSLISENIDIVDLLIENGAKLEIDIIYYVGLIKLSNFNFATKIIARFPDLYSNKQLYEILRSYGASEAESKAFLDSHDLMKEYLLTKEGEETSLNELEMDILDGKISLDNIAEYKDATLTNKYGYSLLHLAILVNQYKLASKLVKDGADIYAKTHNNIMPLQLLSVKENDDLKELAESIIDKIDNIDIPIGSGETLTDILIQNKELEARIVELTKDPLFYLFKKEADLFSLSQDLSKTHIAISHGNDFWSTGIWSTARIISKNYPNVKIHLVKDEILAKGGESFLKQFDAVINPGAGDTYPKLEEFTKADCSFSMDLEKHYQNMLEVTDKNNIPYLGICAGAQHFAMYHGGALRPLEDYNKGQHQVKYIEGTLPHFMALTNAQQKEALQNCEIPEVKFKGDTAHHYAVINNKLGDNMELGAVSEDNVAMSYAHSNGIRYATQFHPENFYYGLDNSNTINQKAWINNFVELAQMHREFRVNGEKHPTEYFAEVKTRLAECLSEPTCLGEDGLASYQELYL